MSGNFGNHAGDRSATPQGLAESGSPRDAAAVVRSVVEDYRRRIIDKYIFFAPNIPPKKLENVLSSYAAAERNEQPLVLIDNTTFGNAKDGGLITDRAIYSHNSLCAPMRMDLLDVETVEFIQKFPSFPLMVNGGEFLQTAFPEKPAMHKVAAMLNEIVIRLHAVPAPAQPAAQEGKSPMEMIKELKDLLDIGAISQQEFEEKRQKYLEKI